MRYISYPRRFTPPVRSDYDTEEEYLEELDAYDAELLRREDMMVEQYLERQFA